MEAKSSPESLASKVAVITDRTGAEYGVYHGADPRFLTQLPGLSLEPDISTQTPRDAGERFRDQTSIDKWLAKAPKEIYFLLDAQDGEPVRGLLWHGQAPAYLNGRLYPYGFAIRIYGEAAGRGLAKPFMRACLTDLIQRQPEAAEGVWLDTAIENELARRLYTSFGYEEVRRDNVRVHMVLSPERISEICDQGA